MPNLTKKPTSMLVPAIVVVALFFGVVGLYLWNAKADNDQKWLAARNMDKFTPEQIALWKRCDSVQVALGQVYAKVEKEFGSMDRNAMANSQEMILPKECLRLREIQREAGEAKRRL